MKIGDRFDWVRKLLIEMDIVSNCVLGKRVGLDNEILTNDLMELKTDEKPGYLTVLIIRKKASVGRKEI